MSRCSCQSTLPALAVPPTLDRYHISLPSMHKMRSSVTNSYFHLNVAAGPPSKRLLHVFNATRGLTRGGVRPILEQVGWVLLQEEAPHVLVEWSMNLSANPSRLVTRRMVHLCTKPSPLTDLSKQRKCLRNHGATITAPEFCWSRHASVTQVGDCDHRA